MNCKKLPGIKPPGRLWHRFEYGQQDELKHGEGAWEAIRRERDKFRTKPITPGSDLEALRNAEDYLYQRSVVGENSYEWGPALTRAVCYNAWKFWLNVGEYYVLVESPYTGTSNTPDELNAGIEGENDALFGSGDDESCACKQ